MVTILLTSKSAAAEGVSQNSLITPMTGSLDSTANYYITLSNSMAATGDGYTLNGNIIELDSSIPNATYEISGTTVSYTIKALNNYDITLNNAIIMLPSTVSSAAIGAIDLNGNTVTITLASGSRNVVEVQKDIAGIVLLTEFSQLMEMVLLRCMDNTNSAGIGGLNNESNGTINITSGNINVSGMWGSAAIGGRKNGDGGLVNISGGQIVISGGLGGNSTNPGIVKITGGNFLPVGEVPTGYTNMNIQNAAGVPIYLNAYIFPSSITSPIIVSDANTSSGEIFNTNSASTYTDLSGQYFAVWLPANTSETTITFTINNDPTTKYSSSPKIRNNTETHFEAGAYGELSNGAIKVIDFVYAYSHLSISQSTGGLSALTGTIPTDLTSVLSGTTITIQATPETGYLFDKWEVSGITLSTTEEISSVLTFTMPENSVAVTPKFEKNQSTKI